MSLFLLVFLLLYGSAHGYLLLRLGYAFPQLRGWWPAPLLWCLLMMAAPVVNRVLEREGQTALASVMAYVGYCWMGLLFVFLTLSLGLELVRLLRWLAHFMLPVSWAVLPGPRSWFLACLGCSILITGYGWFEAADLRTEQLEVATRKLPPGSPKIRIVQISDLHIGLIVGCGQVQRLVDRVQQLKPDLLVATGDIVDGHISHVDGVSGMLRTLQPPLGMYVVFGNHEYYAGSGMSRSFLDHAGFSILRQQTQSVGERLVLVGVDDPAGMRFGVQTAPDEHALLSSLSKNRFVILLKHRPEVVQKNQGLFDLQLSGHVHKGQIFPFNLLTWLRFPVHAGMNRLNGDSLLYVSRGTGTWGPPIRFLAPPEVTVIDLVPAKN